MNPLVSSPSWAPQMNWVLIKEINHNLPNPVNFVHYGTIRYSLFDININSCHNAVRSLILSKLDYCGALLNGISHKDITRLQRIQNRCARLIFKNPNALIPLLFLRSSTGCQWPNVFNSAPLFFIPSSLWTTSHLTTSPASSMCASRLLTPSDPPLSLVFMFRRHALVHFHPLLLVYMEQPPCHDQRHYHHCLFQKVS